MSLKLSPLCVAAFFGALYGLEPEAEPNTEPLPIVPAGQNCKIKLVPQGSGNEIESDVILDFDVVNGKHVVKINVEPDGSSVALGENNQRTDDDDDTWETIHVDNSWPPGVYLGSNPLDTIETSGHYKTIVDDVSDSSDPYPLPNFHVAVHETETGYDLHIVSGKNAVRIPITD